MTNKSTKKALIASVFSLVICFAMLVGSTFAWFTDSASTNVNTIRSGKLDIDIVDKDGKSLDNKTLEWQTADGRAQENILWEPGCTYNLQQFKIVNKGNLAIKYKVTITGIIGDTGLNKVIDWTMADTTGAALQLDTPLSLGAGDSTELYTISGHMQETAGNEYQDKSIDGIAITVFATQDTVEYDSFNKTYDENAWITENAVNNGNGTYEYNDQLYVKDENALVAVTEDPETEGLYTAEGSGDTYIAAADKCVEVIKDPVTAGLYTAVEGDDKYIAASGQCVEVNKSEETKGLYTAVEGDAMYIATDKKCAEVTKDADMPLYTAKEGDAMFVATAKKCAEVKEDAATDGLYTAVDDSSDKYVTTADALSTAAPTGGNVTALDNIEKVITSNDYFQDSFLDVTGAEANTNIDLDDKSVSVESATGKNGIKVSDGATATFSNGTVTMDKTYGSSYPVIRAEQGEITLDNMSVALTADSGNCVSAGSDGGKVIIKNTTVTGPNTTYSNAVHVGSQATLEFDGATIIGGIRAENGGNIIIHSGDFTQATFYYGGSGGKRTVYAGTFAANPTSIGLKLADGSTLTKNADGTWTVTAAA